MKRISAFVIALFMIVAQFPMVATAETNNIEDGTVAYFEPLTSEVEKQTVNTETQLSDLSLPDTLSASIYHVTNTLDKGEVITTSDVDIPVTWNSEPAYDENKAGTYVFSASPEGYTLSENAQLAMITVQTTDKIQDTKTITDWSFVATDYSDYSENELVMAGVSMENQATFDAVVSMLPTQLSVHTENESNTSIVDITDWECVEYKQDVQNNWPDSGEFIFTAKLQEGFECELLPSIKVIIGGITTYDINNKLTKEGLTVAASNGGEVNYTPGSGFTLKANGDYEISGTWTGKLENLDQNNKKAVITLPENVTANVTLSYITIDVSGIRHASAFTVSANGKANITLTGTNILTSGTEHAGLEVPEKAEVKISGDGSLFATGDIGAGIGGGSGSNGGTIIISSGIITATGSYSNIYNTGGAGIGGGYGGNGGTIIISGGIITATSNSAGAGIGGGASGVSGNITITGSANVKATGGNASVESGNTVTDNGIIKIGGNAIVNAIGGTDSAGIGGGSSKGGSGIGSGAGCNNGVTVKIFGTGTKVIATGTNGGYDIGSAKNGNNSGSLSVTDGATLEMKNNGTNVDSPTYKNCTIINSEGISTHYDKNGYKIAGTPVITVQPKNHTVNVGELVTLSATANVTDGGVLSYQWFSNSINSNTGGNAISNADMASYAVPTGTAGTTYYYVIITNTNNNDDINGNKTAIVTSNAAAVTVTIPSSSSSSTSIKNTYSTKKDTINQTISSSNLKSLIRNKKTLTLTSNKLSMSFEPDALKSILDVIPSSARKITFTAVPADLSAYPNAAALIGNHPVYDFTISYKDSKGKEHFIDTNFPTGSVGISLNYKPMSNETAGNLFMVSIDDKGNVTWLDYSSYSNEQVIAGVEHFSLYGIAYKTETPTYTDIKDHWAKTDIEFVVARGLLDGNDNLFTPDSLLTRGMFIKALERLAGIDSQPTHSLNEALTREQVALLLADYAEQLEITMPETLSAIKFADQSKISTTARKAVKLMQRAGVVRGKDGNQFDPQGKVTKAEGAAILHRFMEAVIDPNVMNGWHKNDSGHWQYYQKGKAVTGWQTINKLRYYFNDDGEMYEGWKYDKKKWYYWNNDGAVIGWKFINGKWYYFETDGVMASNTVVDGYQLDLDGAWIQ